MPAHQYRLSRDFRARPEPSGTADRSTSMNLPRMIAKTTIGAVGEDVVGSLQLRAVDGLQKLFGLNVTVELQRDKKRTAAA